jgi:hypothetical protein
MSENPIPTPKVLPYSYDAGAHRRKHCVLNAPAHFVGNGSVTVGKCSSSLSKATADILLKDGLTFPRDLSPDQHPRKIYNVFEGVVYEAVPTSPGASYHGYPWRFLPGRDRIPSSILTALKERSTAAGFEREFKRWMKDYGQ